jgi:antitoxin HicB
MINERLRKRLRKDRPTKMITVKIPVDVLESLRAIAPIRGLNSCGTLLKLYISDGLRRDEAEIDFKRACKRQRNANDANSHIGSSLNDFLQDEGVYEETQYKAIRDVLAARITQEMKAKKVPKLQMSKRMGTSPAQLERLLDSKNEGVTLATLHRAAKALGARLLVHLV